MTSSTGTSPSIAFTTHSILCSSISVRSKVKVLLLDSDQDVVAVAFGEWRIQPAGLKRGRGNQERTYRQCLVRQEPGSKTCPVFYSQRGSGVNSLESSTLESRSWRRQLAMCQA